jgi:hypothetical protein
MPEASAARRRRRRVSDDPFPQETPPRLWDLLFRWAEWRSLKGVPRSAWPKVSYRWEVVNGALVGEPGFCTERGTRPAGPGIYDIFNQAWGDLDQVDQMVLLILVECQGQPWLKGRKWESCLEALRVSRRDYKRLLRFAARNLWARVRARGLR